MLKGKSIIKHVMGLGAVVALLACISTAQAGTVLHESLDSKALGHAYNYTVYLPDDYAKKSAACQRYPVLYLLHGAGGDENDWLVKGGAEATLDRLIKDGKIQPMVVVMPGHRGMWWVDGNGEPAETVLLKELMPTVEEKFHVFNQREGRAVAGLSAGGYATVRLVLRMPELFAAAAALSPAIYQPLPPDDSSARKNPPFQRDGTFDPETWKSLNWPNFIKAYAEQTLRVPLFINSGDHDRFSIALHAAIFFDEMLHIQPDAVEYRVVDGDHKWEVWNETLDDALEYMAPHLLKPSEESCK